MQARGCYRRGKTKNSPEGRRVARPNATSNVKGTPPIGSRETGAAAGRPIDQWPSLAAVNGDSVEKGPASCSRPQTSCCAHAQPTGSRSPRAPAPAFRSIVQSRRRQMLGSVRSNATRTAHGRRREHASSTCRRQGRRSPAVVITGAQISRPRYGPARLGTDCYRLLPRIPRRTELLRERRTRTSFQTASWRSCPISEGPEPK